jgi:hypothetical protein
MFPLDLGSDFREIRGCNAHEFPGSPGHRPASTAGFVFLGRVPLLKIALAYTDSSDTGN